MSSVQFYSAATGLYLGIEFTGSEGDIAANAPAESVAVDAVQFPHTKRLVDGVLIDYQPPAPSPDYEWNDTDKRWRLSAAAEQRNGRRSRAQAEIDALEARQPRALREAALNLPGARERLQAIEDQIIALRAIVNS